VTARLAILADDLTGAADTGGPFAAAGRATAVLLSPDAPAPLPPADVIVLTSESRSLPPDQAREATRRCARRIDAWCQGDASARVYKKIDSTLRGHPAIELEVLMDTLGDRAALVAPAFPAQGRTTANGRQCVNGVPIERTPFGQDGATSDLGALFMRSAREAVMALSRADLQRGVEHLVGRMVRERDIRLWIADAEDDADLSLLAAVALASPLRVLCGSAGLARAIATAGPQGREALGSEGRRHDDQGRGAVLVVAGSRHPATVAQVEALRRDGVVVVRPELPYLEGGDAAGAARTATCVAEVLETGRHAVLAITGLPELSPDGVIVAARLASIVAGVSDRVRVGGLVLTGGDTASAACRALGSVSLWLTGELQPGIATATLIGGRHPGLSIVTKAGGFGDDAALRQALALLGSPRR
jgi:uncharacterized protein YgbK (DUF1537 family)